MDSSNAEINQSQNIKVARQSTGKKEGAVVGIAKVEDESFTPYYKTWAKEREKIMANALKRPATPPVEPCIRVGKDYQATIPDYIPEFNPDKSTYIKNYPESSLLEWKPTDKISNSELTKYVENAAKKHKFSEEQSLGLLYWHDYNTKETIPDLENYQPCTDEWTEQEKTIFERAVKQYDKKFFERIPELLPTKTMKSLVQYYYNRKLRVEDPSINVLEAMAMGPTTKQPTGRPTNSANRRSVGKGATTKLPTGNISSSAKGGAMALGSTEAEFE